MIYKEFNNIDVIKSDMIKKENVKVFAEEKRMLRNEVINMMVKAAMICMAIYVIMVLVCGLTAHADSYSDYFEWRKMAENTALEHISNNDLYNEVWEAEDFRRPGYMDVFLNRKNEIEIVEHTQVAIAGTLLDGRFYGYGNVNEFIVVQDRTMSLKVGDMVDCWLCYGDSNYIDDIESIYYIKTMSNIH